MKPLRLLALVSVVCCSAASIAIACDQDKSTAASTASRKSEKACCAKGTSKTSATTAAYSKGTACSADSKTAAAMKAACEKDPAVAAAMGCSMHGTSATTASTASMDHCMGSKGTKTSATAAGASCSAHGTMASGMKCASHTASMAHGDCSACTDWEACEDEIRATGASSQVVPLKNGAMIVYTAETADGVKSVQAAVARRNDKMQAAQFRGDATKLCPDCRQLRGALASGKLSREVVNVERGCMTLLTSTDRAVVQKIHEMTGSQLAVRN